MAADQLLDLGFLVHHVLAYDRIEFLDFDLIGGGALVLVGGVEVAGTSDKLDSFIQAIGTASILETVRSGVTGIARGDKVLSI